MSNPVIGSPSSFANMSRAELDLVAQAAEASGFNPYDILYGSRSSSRRSTPLGTRTSTPAGSGISQDLSFETQFSIGGVGPIVVPPFTPPTPQPSSLDFSSPRSTLRRRRRGGGRRRQTPSPAGPPRPRAGRRRRRRRAAGGGRRRRRRRRR